MAQETIKLKDDAEARLLFGSNDEVLKKLEKAFDVNTLFRSGDLIISSGRISDIKEVKRILCEFLEIIRGGGYLSRRAVDYAVKRTSSDMRLNDIFMDRIELGAKRAHITPKSRGQKLYVDAMRENDMVFCIGPAGTGKTYLAVSMAVNALRQNTVSRIVLTRPAVEAGESLGFLPGNMYDKVNPYLRPLYDALHDMVEPAMIKDHIDNGIIEVVPLAFMRGRTLNDSFIIMDEAQNSTPEQMKMFLTRLGFDSKAVITGDITQSDLPGNKLSGLVHAQSILKDTEGIKFVALDGADVIRHGVVQRIIEAYRKTEREKIKKR
jgi:phosphate starvation-inducible PhoH-like protein